MRLSDLEVFLEDDLSWRKFELSSLFTIAETSRQQSGVDSDLHKTTLKALYLLLYSHWEGFIKKSCKIYLHYINNKKIETKELTHIFTALALKKSITSCYSKESLDSLSISTYLDFVTLHTTKLTQKFKVNVKIDTDFDDEFIKTFSNLSLKNYRNLLESIDLPFFPFFSDEEHNQTVTNPDGTTQNVTILSEILDFSLLYYRHSIAHSGATSEALNIDTYQNLQNKILYLMDLLVMNISDFCHKEFYKSCNSVQKAAYIDAKNTEVKDSLLMFYYPSQSLSEEFLTD